jgi:multidrug efflux system membrane fusion protein
MGSSKGPMGSKTGGSGAEGSSKQGNGSAGGPGQNSNMGPNAVPPSGGSSSNNAPANEAPSERPRWMDRLPPELVDKVKAMSPEERRAFFQKLRERRQSQGD